MKPECLCVIWSAARRVDAADFTQLNKRSKQRQVSVAKEEAARRGLFLDAADDISPDVAGKGKKREETTGSMTYSRLA